MPYKVQMADTRKALLGPTVNVEYVAASVDKRFYVAPRTMRVMKVILCVTVAGTNGSDVTVMVEKVASGTAIGSGVDVLSATLNLKGTADTNQTGALSTVAGAVILQTGDSLALDFTGTLTSATGVITVTLTPVD